MQASSWTDDAIAAALAEAGFLDPGASIAAEPRDGRLAVRLAGDRMAWFPTDETGLAALVRERRALRLIETHCAFRAPRVLHEDAAGWDVRAIVPGVCKPFERFERLKNDRELARRTGDELGRLLADQHANIPAAELAGWLPSEPDWPRRQDLPHLPSVTSDAELLRRIGRALELYYELPRDPAPVLIHCDVGLHNVAFDAATERVAGVFDYDGAAFGDRRHDFKYLQLGLPGEPMLGAAVAAYEPLTGVAVDLPAVRLFHAAAAIAFLAFRFGHAPDEPWCGRTLAQDLAWTDQALSAAGF